MFALEIDFHDGISPPETILLRKTNAIIGSSELAHVVIEGAASSFCELRIIRGLGREFSCVPVRRAGQTSAPVPFLEGTFPGDAALKLGDLSLHVTSLDVDLALLGDETPAQGAIRVLRTALRSSSPLFPAVAVLGARPMFVSFSPDQYLLIGRSRRCGLRLDAADVSSEHAQVGITGDRCWIEDLGSTNGTFVGIEKVSGRRYLQRGEVFSIGLEFNLEAVFNREDVARINAKTAEYKDSGIVKSYPCVVTNSEFVRPSRVAIRSRGRLTVGRDPANDIWVSAPHISRKHLDFVWDGIGPVRAIDNSGNGTFVAGERLPKGVPVELERGLIVLDLCSGILLAVCFSEDDEVLFLGPQRYGAQQLGGGKIMLGDGFSEGHDENKGKLLRKAEERTKIMSGITDYIPREYWVKNESSPSYSGENAAQREAKDASDTLEPEFTADLTDGGGLSGGAPKSNFSRFQRGRQIKRVRSQESDSELLSKATFDEFALEPVSLSKPRRFLIGVLICVLLIVILFFVLSIINPTAYTS